MRPSLILLFLASLLAVFALPAAAQTSVEISDAAAVYTYGEQVSITAQIIASAPIQNAYVFVQPQGSPAWVAEAQIKNNAIHYQYTLADKPLEPFSRTEYWFRLTLASGEEYTSDAFWFYYDDNRFTWSSLENERFQVHWYGRDIAFGQAALNAAEIGLKQAQNYLPADPPAPLRVFVYSSTTDFQQAMQLSAQSWMAGHASPELDTVLVSIPPGPEERLELERQVPHELAHILQYRLAGDSYTQIPTWLLEGSASLAELFPNPDYGSALENAVQSETLIPMRQLCSTFPREASGAFLAYAQSASFTRFLHQNFGTSGLKALLDAYKDGKGCEEGPQAAFGATLSELEYRWRQEVLGVDLSRLILRNLAPYLVLLALLVIVPLVGGFTILRKKGYQSVNG